MVIQELWETLFSANLPSFLLFLLIYATARLEREADCKWEISLSFNVSPFLFLFSFEVFHVLTTWYHANTLAFLSHKEVIARFIKIHSSITQPGSLFCKDVTFTLCLTFGVLVRMSSLNFLNRRLKIWIKVTGRVE